MTTSEKKSRIGQIGQQDSGGHGSRRSRLRLHRLAHHTDKAALCHLWCADLLPAGQTLTVNLLLQNFRELWHGAARHTATQSTPTTLLHDLGMRPEPLTKLSCTMVGLAASALFWICRAFSDFLILLECFFLIFDSCLYLSNLFLTVETHFHAKCVCIFRIQSIQCSSHTNSLN